MKFKVKKDEIFRELQLLQGIVEKRNTMPILANILVHVAEDRIELTGTDLEVGLKSHLDADIETPGAMTISGKKIFEIVRSLPDGRDVTFSGGDDLKMDIVSGASEFKVLCLPKDDYPQVPEARFEKGIRLPLENVKEMIDRVFFAIAQEQRYYLNGALMILNNGSLEMVSTDGHRLAYASLSAPEIQAAGEIRGIVSKKTLGELRKFEDETVEFDLDENNLFFRVKGRTLISRIIEGKFPNYEAVIPKQNPHNLTISRDGLVDAIRRVSLFSTERSRGIKFIIRGDQVDLFSSNPEIGEAKDTVGGEYEGEDLEVGFNSQYLIDFLTTLKSEKVIFELKDENSAALIRPVGEEGIRSIYVVMPMKI